MGSPAQASCPQQGEEAPQTPSGTDPKYRPLTWKETSALHPNSLLAPRLASSPSCHPQEAPPHPKSLYTGAVPARVCVSGVCMRDVGDLNV